MNKGFSLLEVMIAIAILAVSLMVILNFQSTAVVASGRAQNLSIATMLARHQMASLALKFEKDAKKGEMPDEKSEEGSFDDIGYPDFRWKMTVRKVEIPAVPLPEESGGEVLTKIVGSITEQISKAMREMKLAVSWKELDTEDSIEIVTHIISMETGGFSTGTGTAPTTTPTTTPATTSGTAEGTL